MVEIEKHSQGLLEKLQLQIRNGFQDFPINENQLCIYACGSLGRLDMIEKTDLDLFFILTGDEAEDKINNKLLTYRLFSKLYDINSELGYMDPSKNGRYWHFTLENDLLDIGSRQEDFNNSLTARMLLILESKPVYGENVYKNLIEKVVDIYFKDYVNHSNDFYPLFVMNDIERYWKLLCLNYENAIINMKKKSVDKTVTSSNEMHWKRLKLRFARQLTCYSLIACLFKKGIDAKYVTECIQRTPLERLRMLAETDSKICPLVNNITTEYKWFLDLKKNDVSWWNEETKKTAYKKADEFHDMVAKRLIRAVGVKNMDLFKKSDFIC